MYAVIETGGKQYRVEVGTELEVELLDAEPGKTITLERVLLVADGDDSTIGRPVVADASVSAEVVSQTRGPKLIAFKYRPKARSRVKKGHRQELTVLRIADITIGGKSAAKDARKADEAAKAERSKAEEAAAAQAAKDAELAAKLAVGSDAPAPKTALRTKAEPAETVEVEAGASGKPGRAKKTEAKATETTEADAETTEKTQTAGKAETAAAKPSTSKRASTKASDSEGESEDTGESEAKPAPKRTRATKKDE
jgi:large subunit ribosomal protein L21